MKTYKINFKLKTVLLSALIIVSFIFVGCKNDSDLGKNIDGLAYLSLSNSINSQKFSNSDLQTYEKAYQRMEITQENGIYKTKWTSGKQINISEDLFKLFKDGISFSNQYYAKLKQKQKQKVVRFKTSAENGGSNTDCVQQAIWSVMGSFNCGSSYNNVNSWVTNEYGNNGLTSNSQFIGACDQFLDGYASTISSGYGSAQAGQKIIVVLNNGSSVEHAGVLVTYANGAIIYTDKDGQHALITSQTFTCYIASGCE